MSKVSDFSPFDIDTYGHRFEGQYFVVSNGQHLLTLQLNLFFNQSIFPPVGQDIHIRDGFASLGRLQISQ